MAPNVIDPLSDESSPIRSTNIIPNPIDTFHQNPSSLPPQRLQRPRFYPIFDPLEIKLQRLAKAKAAAMAQFDDEICATLFDDDDLPLSNNIKASAAQFASLCDNESFPAAPNIPDHSIHITHHTLTHTQHTLTSELSPDTEHLVVHHRIKPPLDESFGVGQGTAMSPHQFILDLCAASSFNAPDIPERAHDERQDRTSLSNSDSLTENTSALTMTSL